MTLSGLMLFAAVYIAAVASPGPGVVLVISRSLGRGLDQIGWFIAGFLAGDYVLFCLAAAGLAVIAQSFEGLFTIIRYAGAAYLIYLAWKMWRQPATPVSVGADDRRETPMAAFMSSFLLTVGNPKAIVFFLSIMPLAVDMSAMTVVTFVELSVVIALVLPTVLFGYAALADRARRVFSSQQALGRINKATAAMMAGAAVVIATR